jgi:catechol 2,3-dioxygenase-like lactoylglutathione lyase family enzyme
MALLALGVCGLVSLSAWKLAVSCEQPTHGAPSSVTASEGETGQERTSSDAPVKIDGVVSVGMTVSDMDRSIEFYTSVLSFKKLSDVEAWGDAYERLQGLFGLRMRIVCLQLGEETLELTEYLAPGGRPIPLDSRSNDRWFQHVAIIVTDMDKAYQHLRQHKVKHASTGPQTLPEWNKSAGGIQAFYFKDPDAHVLEILHFPKGKGDPKWHRPGEKLFLGIDHTAIVVGNTDASLRFYRDTLGLKVAGTSENYGTEQEHLNDVFGARLRITTLKAARGPGVELLEYLAPGDGRPMPADTRASDLWHWQIRVEVGDVKAAEHRLKTRRVGLVSPALSRLPDSQLGYKQGLVVRDPDGHQLLLSERVKSRHGSTMGNTGGTP